MIAQTKASVERIQDFIGEEDQKKLIHDYTSNALNIAIEIDIGEYAWENK